MQEKKVRVLVIVDSLLPEKRRHVFWEDVVDLVPEAEVELVCLPEAHDQQRFIEFNPFAWNIVIFNWDVADGDATFRSDKTQHIFKYHYQKLLTEYVEKGGIVIIEAQTSYWSPDQEAYDLLLNPKSVVCQKEERFGRWGITARVHSAYSDHPLLVGMPQSISSNYAANQHLNWFPEGSVDSRVIAETHPEKLFVGSFKKWKGKWIPLLVDDRHNAILLLACEGSGLVFSTTMFLGSSRNKPLLRVLLTESLAARESSKSYFQKLRRLRLLSVFVVFCASIAVVVFLTQYFASILSFSSQNKYVIWSLNFLAGAFISFLFSRVPMDRLYAIFRKIVNR